MNRPKLIACYSFRYDKKYIEGLHKNLDFVDEFVTYDDSKNLELWYHEGKIRQRLIREAKLKGADWILGIDPDERFEKNAGGIIRKLIEIKRKVVYSFRFRELWNAYDQYRVDGIWGLKFKPILFPVFGGQMFHYIPLHSPWRPKNPQYKEIITNINLYHLKSVYQKDRTLRKEIYKKIDPKNRLQRLGYDYLDSDGKNVKIEKIPKGREYYPEYH